MRTIEEYLEFADEVYDGHLERTEYLRACVRYMRRWDEAARKRPRLMPLLYWRFVHVPKLKLFPPVLVISRDPAVVWKQKFWSPDRVWACSSQTSYIGSWPIYSWQGVPRLGPYSDRISIN
ncbi:MAG: hypothetical protein OXF20_07470 [Gammaproteobacteria bacterium]|nr:hypothetical protein [Gammaproteobacteria bacterium]